MNLKVGDIVWARSEEQYCIMSYEISSISKDGWYSAIATDVPNDECMDLIDFEESDIGEFVFFSSEDCEKHEREDYEKQRKLDLEELKKKYCYDKIKGWK